MNIVKYTEKYRELAKEFNGNVIIEKNRLAEFFEKCYNCKSGSPTKCSNLQIAGEDFDADKFTSSKIAYGDVL